MVGVLHITILCYSPTPRDTVQSTGVMVSRRLPFTDTNTAIRVFRQALSLDEVYSIQHSGTSLTFVLQHRSRFRPNLYHYSEPEEVTDLKRASTWKFRTIKSAFRRLLTRKDPKNEYLPVHNGLLSNDAEQNLCADGLVPGRTQTNAESATDEASFTCTDVLEVWFSGCHSGQPKLHKQACMACSRFL